MLYLHGGPGGETSKSDTTYFNPSIYRVILFDQRGSGKSRPTAEIRENTTEHILSDIEVLRKHIGVGKWHCVFGGSWGSTLGLLYAQAHPDLVGSLVLQGIFTVSKEDLDWSQRSGAAASIFPELFRDFLNHLPEEDRNNPYASYYKLLTGDDSDRQARVAAARAWNTWDMSIGTVVTKPERVKKLLEDDNWSLSHATLECHYFVHGAWLEDGKVLKKENLDRIRHIPGKYYEKSKMIENLLANGETGTIIHGRYDLVCPAQTAYNLHQGWPESRMCWIPDAGHSPTVCDFYIFHEEPVR